MTQTDRSQGVRATIVIPAYNEDQVIGDFLAQIQAAFADLPGCDLDILVVNDGSTDKTAWNVKEAALRDPRIRMLSFARNLGQQRALVAGLEHARGDVVVTMDADGQHPPSKAREMVEEWLKDPTRHVVQAVRKAERRG